MNDIHKLRIWCQKVIPLVYDNSLSYYEVLGKVVKYLNDAIENVNALSEIVDNIQHDIGEVISEYFETDEFKELVDEKVQENIDELYEIIDDMLRQSKRSIINNSDAAITNLLNIIGSYYHNTDFEYGNFHGAFNTVCYQIPGVEKYQIDCSTLCGLVFGGVALENSRYTKDYNVGYGGYYIPVDDIYIQEGADRPYGMTSDKRANWAFDHGYFYEPKNPREVQIGDEIFVSYENSPNVDRRWRGVNHCGIVVGYVEATECYIVIDAADRTYVIGKTYVEKDGVADNYHIVGFARYPLESNSFKPQDLIKNASNSIEGVTRNVVISAPSRTFAYYTLRTTEKLVKNRAYTLLLEATNIGAPLYFYLQGANNKTTTLFSATEKSDIVISTFYINDTAEDFEPISENNDGVSEYWYRLTASVPEGVSVNVNSLVKRLSLFDGFVRYSYNTDWVENNANTKYIKPLELITYSVYSSTDESFISDVISRIEKLPLNVEYNLYCRVTNSTGIVPNERYMIKLIRFTVADGTTGRVNGVAKLTSLATNFEATLRLSSASAYPTDFSTD